MAFNSAQLELTSFYSSLSCFAWIFVQSTRSYSTTSEMRLNTPTDVPSVHGDHTPVRCEHQHRHHQGFGQRKALKLDSKTWTQCMASEASAEESVRVWDSWTVNIWHFRDSARSRNMDVSHRVITSLWCPLKASNNKVHWLDWKLIACHCIGVWLCSRLIFANGQGEQVPFVGVNFVCDCAHFVGHHGDVGELCNLT